MARPRTFDEERVLDAAMRTFWAKGYEATSTQDLCDATGLGRSSIYNTFHSKRDLFRRALALYLERTTGSQLAVLEDRERSASDRIRTLFAMVVQDEEDNRRDGHGLGCLTVNTIAELSGRDAEGIRLIQRDTEHRLTALRSALSAGQHDGDISSTRDADALARFVTATISGIRISSQGGADRAVLEAIAATALDALTAR